MTYKLIKTLKLITVNKNPAHPKSANKNAYPNEGVCPVSAIPGK